MKDELYQIADELRAIASLGIRYTESGYDRERYEHILKASARILSTLENVPFDDIYTQYTGNLAHLSAILCVEAAVFRGDKILLIQRRDDQTWAMPGGLAEVGESLSQAVERELWEEAGVRGDAIRLLGIFDSRIWRSNSRLQLCLASFLVQSEDIPALHDGNDGSLSSLSETLDLGFFDEHHLPPMHPGHDLRVPMVFKLWRGEIPAPYFDPSVLQPTE
jgi:8-oxo-dGTP pyrophosphatase MutT (NUDIX family)